LDRWDAEHDALGQKLSDLQPQPSVYFEDGEEEAEKKEI